MEGTEKQCQNYLQKAIERSNVTSEGLERQKDQVKQRVDVLECLFPAMMICQMFCGSKQSSISDVNNIIEKQMEMLENRGVAQSLSQHFDPRVREANACLKEAQCHAQQARENYAEKEARLGKFNKLLEESRKLENSKLDELKHLEEHLNRAKEDKLIPSNSLERAESESSIKSEDLQCLGRVRQLAETELRLSNHVRELEAREETYMRTLQQSESLWSSLERQAPRVDESKKKLEELQGEMKKKLDELQAQLNEKNCDNRVLVERLDNQSKRIEDLEKSLQECRDSKGEEDDLEVDNASKNVLQEGNTLQGAQRSQEETPCNELDTSKCKEAIQAAIKNAAKFQNARRDVSPGKNTGKNNSECEVAANDVSKNADQSKSVSKKLTGSQGNAKNATKEKNESSNKNERKNDSKGQNFEQRVTTPNKKTTVCKEVESKVTKCDTGKKDTSKSAVKIKGLSPSKDVEKDDWCNCADTMDFSKCKVSTADTSICSSATDESLNDSNRKETHGSNEKNTREIQQDSSTNQATAQNTQRPVMISNVTLKPADPVTRPGDQQNPTEDDSIFHDVLDDDAVDDSIFKDVLEDTKEQKTPSLSRKQSKKKLTTVRSTKKSTKFVNTNKKCKKISDENTKEMEKCDQQFRENQKTNKQLIDAFIKNRKCTAKPKENHPIGSKSSCNLISVNTIDKCKDRATVQKAIETNTQALTAAKKVDSKALVSDKPHQLPSTESADCPTSPPTRETMTKLGPDNNALSRCAKFQNCGTQTRLTSRKPKSVTQPHPKRPKSPATKKPETDSSKTESFAVQTEQAPSAPEVIPPPQPEPQPKHQVENSVAEKKGYKCVDRSVKSAKPRDPPRVTMNKCIQMNKPSRRNLDCLREEMERTTCSQSKEPTTGECSQAGETLVAAISCREEIACEAEDFERAREECVSAEEQRDRGCAISSADDSAAQEIRGLCSQARTVDPCVDDSGLGEIDRVIREACSSKEIADEDICDATMALGGSASQASLLAGECSSRCFAGLLEDPQLGSIAVGRPYLATIDVAQPMCHLRLGKSCISKPRNRCPLHGILTNRSNTKPTQTECKQRKPEDEKTCGVTAPSLIRICIKSN